ncbi:hypothetical protein VP01_1104g2 [Puccinia sorghi]|uniref:Uncharacterized protein n=1 Tax=Puccinia sorghi TaxID=27349 RepID=A0A0L6VSR4_9BASI|nr:hypothetical protein VP01_1104g2 [Puccinia sorghi]
MGSSMFITLNQVCNTPEELPRSCDQTLPHLLGYSGPGFAKSVINTARLDSSSRLGFQATPKLKPAASWYSWSLGSYSFPLENRFGYGTEIQEELQQKKIISIIDSLYQLNVFLNIKLNLSATSAFIIVFLAVSEEFWLNKHRVMGFLDWLACSSGVFYIFIWMEYKFQRGLINQGFLWFSLNIRTRSDEREDWISLLADYNVPGNMLIFCSNSSMVFMVPRENNGEGFQGEVLTETPCGKEDPSRRSQGRLRGLLRALIQNVKLLKALDKTQRITHLDKILGDTCQILVLSILKVLWGYSGAVVYVTDIVHRFFSFEGFFQHLYCCSFYLPKFLDILNFSTIMYFIPLFHICVLKYVPIFSELGPIYYFCYDKVVEGVIFSFRLGNPGLVGFSIILYISLYIIVFYHVLFYFTIFYALFGGSDVFESEVKFDITPNISPDMYLGSGRDYIK